MQWAKSRAVRLSVTLTVRQGRCASRKTNRLAVPLRRYSLELAGLGRDGLADLADQLGRALVEADDRSRRIGGLSVEIEHVLHAGDVGAIDLGDAPHVAAPRLEIVLRQAAAHRLARQLAMLGQLDHRAGQ
jgi:hypothetical protein